MKKKHVGGILEVKSFKTDRGALYISLFLFPSQLNTLSCWSLTVYIIKIV